MAPDSLAPEPKKTFSKVNRLRKRREFLKVYDERKSLFFRFGVFYVSENGLGLSRIGLTVSRKVGDAVVRNRVKRVVKEAFRLSLGDLGGAFDLVFNAKKESARMRLGDAMGMFRELREREWK